MAEGQKRERGQEGQRKEKGPKGQENEKETWRQEKKSFALGYPRWDLNPRHSD